MKKVPKKIKFPEFAYAFIYGFMTWASAILLTLSTFHIGTSYILYLFFKQSMEYEVIQIAVWIAAGTFLHLFVYDKHCQDKFNSTKKKK